MYEYKVEIYNEIYKVKEAEKGMNQLAGKGWKVIAIMPNAAMGYGMIVTFEREKN